MARNYRLVTFDDRCDSEGCAARAVFVLEHDVKGPISHHCVKHARLELRAAEAGEPSDA